MSRNHPLEVADVERGLKAMGFSPRPQDGTSHVQWVRRTDPTTGQPQFHKVTVDAPKSPFSPMLIKSMASQAGIPVKQFRELCTPQGIKKAKKNKLKWFTDLFGLNKRSEEESLSEGE